MSNFRLFGSFCITSGFLSADHSAAVDFDHELDFFFFFSHLLYSVQKAKDTFIAEYSTAYLLQG